MTQPNAWGIAPFFIVSNLTATLAFYRDMLGFEIVLRIPPEDEYFGIVQRNGAMLMFKALGEVVDGNELRVEPVPNYQRKPAYSLDAHLYVPDPDALAAEYAARGVRFSAPLTTNHDSLRGFVIEDLDGYGLFFGRPEE